MKCTNTFNILAILYNGHIALNNTGLKIQDRIIYKMLMFTYKSYYNIAPLYLCELINKNETYVNTRLGTDHHQLIMPPISGDCSYTFLVFINLCCSIHANRTN